MFVGIPVNATAQDCNNNGIPDVQDIDPLDPDGNGEVSLDCDENSVPDECDIAACFDNLSACSDCDGNGVLDICDGANGARDGFRILDEGASYQARTITMGGDILAVYWHQGFSSTQIQLFRNLDGMWTDFDDIQLASSGPTNEFNRLIDIEGSQLALRTPQETIRIYDKTTNGLSLAGEISRPPGISSFGMSVAISGDRIIVGRPTTVVGLAGLVDIYRRNGADWGLEQTISDPMATQFFGLATDISGDVAVVGDPAFDSFRGRLHILEFDGSQWYCVQTQVGIPGSGFGAAVAAGESWVVGGGPWINPTVNSPAPVWTNPRGSNPNSWGPSRPLMTVPGQTGNRFGFSIAMHEDRLVVGAPKESGTTAPSGALIYELNGASWQLIGVARDDNSPASDGFGRGVAVSGARIGVANWVPADVPGGVQPFVFPLDCDGNGRFDQCHIATGILDANGNLRPDGCEFDCDANVIADFEEPAENDCNGNFVPDECEPHLETIDEFVIALLSSSQGVNELCAFDNDGNGIVDGLDIAPFVAQLLMP